MEIWQSDRKFTIVEGTFVDGVNHGLTRNFSYDKALKKVNMMLGHTTQGKFNGVCSIITSANETFQGHVVIDKRNGVGKITYLDNSIYIGESKDDKRHGKGSLVLPNGSYIKGLFLNDGFKQPYNYDDSFMI